MASGLGGTGRDPALLPIPSRPPRGHIAEGRALSECEKRAQARGSSNRTGGTKCRGRHGKGSCHRGQPGPSDRLSRMVFPGTGWGNSYLWRMAHDEITVEIHSDGYAGDPSFGIHRSRWLPYPQHLVRLQAQPPLRMRQAVGERRLGVGQGLLWRGAIHRLKEKRTEIQGRKPLGLCGGLSLWKHKFKLIAAAYEERGIRLRADAQMIDPPRHALGAIRLHGHLESPCMQRVDCGFIELEQRLTPGTHHQWATTLGAPGGDARPTREHSVRQRLRTGKLAAIGTAANELGVAELADRLAPVLFASPPEIPPPDPAEHGRTTRVEPLALERVEDLADDVTHAWLTHPRTAQDRLHLPR